MGVRTFELEERIIETAQGPLAFWGRFAEHRPERPLGLVIRGAFAERNTYQGLPSSIREADVVLTHLPGMHSPFLSESSVRAFADALDSAMGVFGRRPHVLGFSLGGVVGLAMRAPLSILAVDPPLQTAPLWPLRRAFEQQALEGSPQLRDWIWSLFGVAPGRAENRDYRSLVDEVTAPTIVLVAGEPLEPERQTPTLPGLITDADRAWLSSHPRVTALKAPGVGHNIPGRPHSAVAMVDLYRQMIDRYSSGHHAASAT